MRIENTAVIVLAAGKGTRMKSNCAKVLHSLAGRPILAYVLETAVKVAGPDVVVVIGSQAEAVRTTALQIADVQFAYQTEQRGTGHAVQCALPKLGEQTENVVILCGDVPLITENTLNRLVRAHQEAAHTVTLLGVDLENPRGYGRVVINPQGQVQRIVEEADATSAEKEITIVNSGIYCVHRPFLEQAVPRLGSANAQKEVYLTDIIEMAASSALPIGFIVVEQATELLGINTPEDLRQVEALLSTA
jgi:UDP-N-acetylglucosamine diphosphorylase/glucosamine-1-phosphate N-acetyltransferase